VLAKFVTDKDIANKTLTRMVHNKISESNFITRERASRHKHTLLGIVCIRCFLVLILLQLSFHTSRHRWDFIDFISCIVQI
jgi:hypothetical protein